MEKVNIQLVNSEEHTSKNTGKQYTKFLTNIGWCSCFDSKTALQLKQHIGQVVIIDIVENGKYKNITMFYSLGNPEQLVQPPTHQPMQVPPNTPYTGTDSSEPITQSPPSFRNGTDKNCELMTVKDIFIKLLDEGIDVTEQPPDKGIRHFNPETIQSVMKQAIELVKQARKELE